MGRGPRTPHGGWTATCRQTRTTFSISRIGNSPISCSMPGSTGRAGIGRWEQLRTRRRRASSTSLRGGDTTSTSRTRRTRTRAGSMKSTPWGDSARRTRTRPTASTASGPRRRWASTRRRRTMNSSSTNFRAADTSARSGRAASRLNSQARAGFAWNRDASISGLPMRRLATCRGRMASTMPPRRTR